MTTKSTRRYSSFPRKAGIQEPQASAITLDPRFREGDEEN
jgi:hypothetical protein